MLTAQRHTFQVLTKRPGRMRSLLRRPGFADLVYALAATEYGLAPGGKSWWPLPNAWLGVSAETQKWANVRIPPLLDTPAAMRFVSAEPLLGPIDLTQAVIPMGYERGHGLTASYIHLGDCCRRLHGVDWVIAGGESGPHARPMHPDWARSLRDQCQQAGTAFFFKQWGNWSPAPATVPAHKCRMVTRDGDLLPGPPWPWPGDTGSCAVMRRTTKTRAGRLLDGRTWEQFPTPRQP